MIRLAVMDTNNKSRSLMEAVSERRDLRLADGPPEEADVLYFPDYTSLNFTQIRSLLRAGKHVLFGSMGAADRGELEELIRTAEENNAVLLEYIHLAFNPCMAALAMALKCLGPVCRIRFYSCEYAFCCKGLRTAPGQVPVCDLQRGALFQRGLDCIYPLVRLFGTPKQADAQQVFTENGMDAAGTVKGYMGDSEVELVYSKISGSHIPSLIQGKNGSLLIRNIQNLNTVSYFDRRGTEETLISCSDSECRRQELDQCMEFIKGVKDWRAQMDFSFRVLRVVEDIRCFTSIPSHHRIS